VEVHISYLSQI